MSTLVLILFAVIVIVAAVLIIKRRKRIQPQPIVANLQDKPTANRFDSPTIQLIHSSDAQQHTGELKSILMRMKTENRICDFTAHDININPDKINFKNEDRQGVIVVLTNGLVELRSGIEMSLKNITREKSNIKLIEIIIDNLPYHNDFISLPQDLIPIRSRVDMNAIWKGIEHDLHVMFPKHEIETPEMPPTPIVKPEKTLSLRGVVKGFQQRFEIDKFRNKPRVVWTFRIECYHHDKLINTIPVQMVGDKFEGDINDGDEVEVFRWKKGTILKTNRVKNWTTDVEVRSSGGNAVQALGCLIFLLFLGVIAFIILENST